MMSASEEALYCRLRNRIIEHLELVSSAQQQLSYQQSAPVAQVSNELFCGWEDFVCDDAIIETFMPPAFTMQEQQAVREFNTVLVTVALSTPQHLPYIADFIGTIAWQELNNAACKALAVFQERGKSSEQ